MHLPFWIQIAEGSLISCSRVSSDGHLQLSQKCWQLVHVCLAYGFQNDSIRSSAFGSILGTFL